MGAWEDAHALTDHDLGPHCWLLYLSLVEHRGAREPSNCVAVDGLGVVIVWIIQLTGSPVSLEPRDVAILCVIVRRKLLEIERLLRVPLLSSPSFTNSLTIGSIRPKNCCCLLWAVGCFSRKYYKRNKQRKPTNKKTTADTNQQAQTSSQQTTQRNPTANTTNLKLQTVDTMKNQPKQKST